MLDVKDIMQKDLHVVLLRDNYIHGMKYSYEEYLIDFLNSSKIKFDKGNKEFKRISSQAHGECDATNDIYEIDFKIFADTNHIGGKKNYSLGIVRMGGATFYTQPERVTRHIEYYDMLKLIRGKKVDFYRNIMEEEDDMYVPLIKFMKKIEMDKNILLFLPFQYYFEHSETTEEVGRLIAKCIAEEFRELVAYRKEITLKDTYIGFVSKDKFILLKENDGCVEYYDMIKTKNSRLYCDLVELSTPY